MGKEVVVVFGCVYRGEVGRVMAFVERVVLLG
jgi:hypothetical protein